VRAAALVETVFGGGRETTSDLAFLFAQLGPEAQAPHPAARASLLVLMVHDFSLALAIWESGRGLGNIPRCLVKINRKI
jgi:hypothetical protein